MGDLPTGYIAKLGRAKEHLEALKAAVSDFSGEGKAYTIIKTTNDQTGEFIFHLKVNIIPDLVYWSLMVGDCFHNARTALDHLFFGLVQRQNPNGVKEKASVMQFPILKDASTFKGRKYLKDWVGDAAFRMIEKLQPFNDAKGWQFNNLSFLHDFDIEDKHRLLLPAVSIVNNVQINTATVENRTVALNGQLNLLLVQFEDGAELGRFSPTPIKDVMDMNLRLTFEVIFQGQPGPMSVVKSLEKIIEMIEAIGADFRKFF